MDPASLRAFRKRRHGVKVTCTRPKRCEEPAAALSRTVTRSQSVFSEVTVGVRPPVQVLRLLENCAVLAADEGNLQHPAAGDGDGIANAGESAGGVFVPETLEEVRQVTANPLRRSQVAAVSRNRRESSTKSRRMAANLLQDAPGTAQKTNSNSVRGRP